MKHLAFVQVYDVSLARLRESIECQFRALDGAATSPQVAGNQDGEYLHWLFGALHQWHTTLLFLCESATEGPGLEKAALVAKLNVDRRAMELEIAARMERVQRSRR